jgi:hypothetical protein
MKEWLHNLEFELEWHIRHIIREHGAPIAVTDPKVKRLFQNLDLAAVRRLKEAVYEPGNRYRLSA